MKTRALVLAGIVVLGIAAGCDKKEKAAQGNAKTRLFGVTFQTMNNPFFVDLNEGIKQVVEAHGDRIVTLDAQWNSLKQRNDISDLILQNASGIFINPVNWQGIKGSLLQAKRKGVPCIIVDAPVKDQDLVLCQVASDNVEAGRLAARALAKACRPANLVILHLSVNKACIDRVTGFKEEIAKYPDMQILDVQEGKGTTEGARPVMRDLLGRYPDLNAVFPINDPSALGAISALESAGKLNDVTVVTVDGSAEGIAAIKAGKLLSSSAQFPKEIGRIAADRMYEHLSGRPVEKDIKVRVELITSENVDAFLPGNETNGSDHR
jgi:ribose transport system substrate-binding protein